MDQILQIPFWDMILLNILTYQKYENFYASKLFYFKELIELDA